MQRIALAATLTAAFLGVCAAQPIWSAPMRPALLVWGDEPATLRFPQDLIAPGTDRPGRTADPSPAPIFLPAAFSSTLDARRYWRLVTGHLAVGELRFGAGVDGPLPPLALLAALNASLGLIGPETPGGLLDGAPLLPKTIVALNGISSTAFPSGPFRVTGYSIPGPRDVVPFRRVPGISGATPRAGMSGSGTALAFSGISSSDGGNALPAAEGNPTPANASGTGEMATILIVAEPPVSRFSDTNGSGESGAFPPGVTPPPTAAVPLPGGLLTTMAALGALAGIASTWRRL